jgi:hypothetical protein
MSDSDWPEGAVAQLRVRTDRPERLAAYDRAGRLQFSLAQDVTLQQAVASPPQGFRYDAQGFLFPA